MLLPVGVGDALEAAKVTLGAEDILESPACTLEGVEEADRTDEGTLYTLLLGVELLE